MIAMRLRGTVLAVALACVAAPRALSAQGGGDVFVGLGIGVGTRGVPELSVGFFTDGNVVPFCTVGGFAYQPGASCGARFYVFGEADQYLVAEVGGRRMRAGQALFLNVGYGLDAREGGERLGGHASTGAALVYLARPTPGVPAGPRWRPSYFAELGIDFLFTRERFDTPH